MLGATFLTIGSTWLSAACLLRGSTTPCIGCLVAVSANLAHLMRPAQLTHLFARLLMRPDQFEQRMNNKRAGKVWSHLGVITA